MSRSEKANRSSLRLYALPKRTKSGQDKARQAEQVESFIYRKPSEVDIPPTHW